MTVRFGLLGAGRIGKVHARAIGANPDAKLVAVADAFETAAERHRRGLWLRGAHDRRDRGRRRYRRGGYLHARPTPMPT